MRALSCNRSHDGYNPDLAPFDCYLFAPSKETIEGKKFCSNEGIIEAVLEWACQQPKEYEIYLRQYGSRAEK